MRMIDEGERKRSVTEIMPVIIIIQKILNLVYNIEMWILFHLFRISGQHRG